MRVFVNQIPNKLSSIKFIYLPPWCIEFNEEELVFLEFIIEVGVSEYKDTVFLGDFSSQNCGGEKCEK